MSLFNTPLTDRENGLLTTCQALRPKDRLRLWQDKRPGERIFYRALPATGALKHALEAALGRPLKTNRRKQ